MFIDSPGFGHPDLPMAKVKKTIHNTVGYFTRYLGGIHGIFYIHSILTERALPGMRESVNFLAELTGENTYPHITFLTTKWDLVHQKQLGECQGRESELKNTEWKRFHIGQPVGARYYKYGVSSSHDSEADKARHKVLLTDQVLSRYSVTKVAPLKMPFLERTFGEQAGTVFQVAIGTCATIAGLCLIAVGIVIGVDVNISVNFIFA